MFGQSEFLKRSILFVVSVACASAYSQTPQGSDQKNGFTPTISNPTFSSKQSYGDVELASDRSYLINRKCRVQLIREIDVPALEAGQVEILDVRENDPVQANSRVAKLKDESAKLQKKVAEKNRDVAKVDAENENRIDYASRSVDYAKDIYEKKKTAWEHRSINYVSFRESEFQFNQSRLQLVEARNQQLIAKEKLALEEVNIQAADDLINRHEVKSLIDGQVAEVYVHRGEWVAKGDKVMRVIQMDKLQINGRADAKQLFPGDLKDRRVLVTLKTPNDKEERFEGKVVRIKLENSVSDMYFFVVEVANRKRGDFWLLRPNSNVDIQVILK